jgi:hypothetical protein
MEQPPPPPPPPAVAQSPRALEQQQQQAMSPRSLPALNIGSMHHQQQHLQQNGLSAADPVTVAPHSARGDPQVTAALGGGWNPLGGQGGGSLLSVPQPAPSVAPPSAAPSQPAQPTAAQQQAALAAQLGAPGSNPAGQHAMMGGLGASPTAAAAAQMQQGGAGGAAAQYSLQQALQQMALQQAAQAQVKVRWGL